MRWVGIPSTGSGQALGATGGKDHAYFDSPSTELRTRLSTGLKILSRIVRLRLTNVTEPTEGYADVYGRVGSLLEAVS